jgi:hypothetical protein
MMAQPAAIMSIVVMAMLLCYPSYDKGASADLIGDYGRRYLTWLY